MWQILTLTFVATLSPGPDFFVVSHYSILNGFRYGLIAALGIALGNCVHICIATFGLALVTNSWFQVALQAVASVYLAYISSKILLSFHKSSEISFGSKAVPLVDSPSVGAVFKRGLFTNLLNFKAMVFFVSVLSPLMATSGVRWYVSTASLFFVIFFSFSGVALVFSQVKRFPRLGHALRVLDLVFGIMLLIFSVRLFWEAGRLFVNLV